jgi:hypothetical protein
VLRTTAASAFGGISWTTRNEPIPVRIFSWSTTRNIAKRKTRKILRIVNSMVQDNNFMKKTSPGPDIQTLLVYRVTLIKPLFANIKF